MNLATITILAAQFAQDQAQSRYSGLYTQAINIGCQQFAIDTKCLWKDWTSPLVIASGQASYPLPADFMWEKVVKVNGIELLPISRKEMDRIYRTTRWDQRTGSPQKYIIDPEVGKSQILLWPIPQGNDAGQDFILTYYAYPADLAASSDVPWNNTPLLAQFHIGPAAWAAWFLLQAEQVTDAIAAKKKELLSIYNDTCSQCVNTFKNTVSEPIRMRGTRIYAGR